MGWDEAWAASDGRDGVSAVSARAVIESARHEVADQLDDLDDDDDRDDRGDHDVVLPAVVAVVDGHLTQAAAADGARHRGVADERNRQRRDRLDEGGQRLADEDTPADLPVGSAHHLGGLDLSGVDGQEVRLHESREERRGEDDEGHNGCQGTRGLADDHFGDRNQHDDADDKGQGTHDIDDEGEGLIHALVGGEAALAGLDQEEAQQRSDDDRENRGQSRHHEGLEDRGNELLCEGRVVQPRGVTLARGGEYTDGTRCSEVGGGHWSLTSA